MDIGKLKGVGPKISTGLKNLGIYTVKDAITYYPRDYEDRGKTKPVNEMQDGEMITFAGQVSLVYPSKRVSKGRCINRIVFKNETGYVVGVWFNQPYIKNNFKNGEKVLLYGRVSKKSAETQLIDPSYEKNIDETVFDILPVYPINKNISQKILRKIVKEAFSYIDDEIVETLPAEIMNQYGLPGLKASIRNIHYPENLKDTQKYIRRLKFEELLVFQLGLYNAKTTMEKLHTRYSMSICSEMKDFKEKLPYQLTSAQNRTVREILHDIKQTSPMNRLVQGDVGSGKTIIAAIALFNCAKNGLQGAMMVPTEILAQQHYEALTKLFSQWNICVKLLTGNTSKKEKTEILNSAVDGSVDVIIGTHALIQENVEFKNLALVITDEQHRFGVRQRAQLIGKGSNPHVLVMTATPIPRTLAIFLYGDMDISIINEMPPGRQKVSTYFVKPEMRDRIYGFVKKEIAKGNQCYVVCPLVDESEALEAESAVEMQKMLKEKYFMDCEVGLLHGKMSTAEKDYVMQKFMNGEIKIVVSTTVIEVGVNVPKATVMIIENADRFGLAQLHQLRGRVGRGSEKSYCILVSQVKTQEALNRMEIMTKNSDGFAIAEMDLKLRGSGEFFGLRQHGLPELKIADPVTDFEILKAAKEAAKKIIDEDKLKSSEYEILCSEIQQKFDANFDKMSLN